MEASHSTLPGTSPDMSESISKLVPALIAAQHEIAPATKERRNPFYKSKYSDLADIWDVCREPLFKNGLAVIQTTEAGIVLGTVIIITTLVHTSGEWVRGRLPMTPVKNDPQATGSAITYGRRYGLAAIVGVVSVEDDDGNKASQPDKTETREKPETQGAPAKAATEGRLKSAHDGRTLKPGEEAKEKTAGESAQRSAPPTLPPPHPPAPGDSGATSQTAFHGKLYTALELSGITREELKAYLVSRGLMVDTQVVDNLNEKIVDLMLTGRDKKTGSQNWDLIVDGIKNLRKKT